MHEAIVSELMIELRRSYPNSGFSMAILLGHCRVAMVRLVTRGNDYIAAITRFLSLKSAGFEFDDGYMVPYDLPNSIELVVAHFGRDELT